MKSTADKIKEKRAKREEENEIKEENLAEFKRALNDVAQSHNGEFVLRTLIHEVFGVFNIPRSNDGVALVEHNARRSIYLRYIRPYLEPQIRQELEK